jgi:hypothetical protein
MYISLHADSASRSPDAEETKSDDNEEDNAPIAASLSKAPKVKQVTTSKRPAMRKTKEKRQIWAHVPVVDGPSTYWQGGVDGKRTRTLRTASYRDDDARSDSDDDPEDLLKPGKDYASSSEESVTEAIPQPTALPVLIFHLALITETGCGKNQCDGWGKSQRTNRKEKSTSPTSEDLTVCKASPV